MQKRDARKLSPTELQEKRRQSIRLWKKGYTRREIGEILEVHPNRIGEWIKRYSDSGAAGIKVLKRGRRNGDQRRLSLEEELAIQKKIAETTPDQLKLAFALWTRRAVCELIERECGIKMPVRTCGEYLKRWGFTPQKPARRAYEQNPKAVEQWLKESYPAISARAKAQGAEIHWGDETGVRSDCQHGRTYAPKGKTPVVRIRGKRFSTNMISTVTNQGKLRWMIYRENLSSQVFIGFLKRLTKCASRKIFLIVDNLKVHHSALVKEWVAANSERIEIFYLPSYSPERNPDEYLNNDLKTSLGMRKAPRDRDDLEGNLKSTMHRLGKLPKHVASYFKNQFVTYANAA